MRAPLTDVDENLLFIPASWVQILECLTGLVRIIQNIGFFKAQQTLLHVPNLDFLFFSSSLPQIAGFRVLQKTTNGKFLEVVTVFYKRFDCSTI